MTLNLPPRRDPSPGGRTGSSDGNSAEAGARFADLFGALPRVAPPAALREQVLAAFDAQQRGERRGRRRPGRLLWLPPALVGAAAAAAAVLAIGFAQGGAAGHGESGRPLTKWVTVADAPASSAAPFRFVDDPSLPLQLAAAGPFDGP